MKLMWIECFCMGRLQGDARISTFNTLGTQRYSCRAGASRKDQTNGCHGKNCIIEVSRMFWMFIHRNMLLSLLLLGFFFLHLGKWHAFVYCSVFQNQMALSHWKMHKNRVSEEHASNAEHSHSCTNINDVWGYAELCMHFVDWMHLPKSANNKNKENNLQFERYSNMVLQIFVWRVKGTRKTNGKPREQEQKHVPKQCFLCCWCWKKWMKDERGSRRERES